MGLFKSIKRAINKITGIGGSTNQTYQQPTLAPELDTVTTDITDTTEEASQMEQLSSGKKKGKKSLKIERNNLGGGHAGRNIT